MLYIEKESHIFVAPAGEDYDGKSAMSGFKVYELLGQVSLYRFNLIAVREVSDQCIERWTYKPRLRLP